MPPPTFKTWKRKTRQPSAVKVASAADFEGLPVEPLGNGRSFRITSNLHPSVSPVLQAGRFGDFGDYIVRDGQGANATYRVVKARDFEDEFEEA